MDIIILNMEFRGMLGMKLKFGNDKLYWDGAERMDWIWFSSFVFLFDEICVRKKKVYFAFEMNINMWFICV